MNEHSADLFADTEYVLIYTIHENKVNHTDRKK